MKLGNSIIINIFFLACLVPIVFACPDSMSGAGTENDPCIISSLSNLQAMNQNLSVYYALSTDLDASATQTWNWNGTDYLGFEPIGTEADPFIGGFDGRNHTITDLYVYRPQLDSVGFFGYSRWESDFIKNVGLIDVDITGGYRSGGLGGRINSKVSNCFVQGGTVTGVASNSVAGGFIGQNQDDVENCYSTADVSSEYEAAGFISFNNNPVDKCYSTGSVSDAENQAGFVNNGAGHGSGTVSNSFWDNQTSGQSSSDGGTGKTTAEMKNVMTYTYLPTVGLSSAWDFVGNPYNDSGNEDIWDISGGTNNGYPHLSWSGSPPYPNCPDTSGNWTLNGAYSITEDITCDEISLGASADLTIEGGYTLTATTIESSLGAELTIEGDATLNTTNTQLLGTTISIDSGQTLKTEYSGSFTDTNTCYSSSGTYNLELENTGTGSIEWTGGLNSQVCDLDDLVTISSNYTYVDSAAESELNTSATITLSGLPFSGDITIMRDVDGSGTFEDCPAGVCTLVSYAGGVATFTVTQFSGYSVSGASATVHNQSHWVNPYPAGSIVTEGGNVTATDLEVNASTEKWAGAFGDISGRLILAQNADINFLYNWTFAHPDKGEVCVTTNPAAIWTSLAALTAIGQVDSAYGFDTGATDSATNTMTTTSPFDIGSSSGLVLNALIDNAGWETGVVGLNGAGSNIPNDLAFCVNISPGATNYKGSTSDYEIIMPANETVGTTQTYYFYTELV